MVNGSDAETEPWSPVAKPSMWRLLVLLSTNSPAVENDSSDRSRSIELERASSHEPAPRGPCPDWTATHGFFALMGGFALDLSRRPDLLPPLPNGRTRLVLTPKAVEWLANARPDLWPNLSAEQIRDKSKANHLAKTLICAQAAYFCVHFLSRLGLGLAVTLLEINTFAHAFCALVVYLVWWDKPLDVDQPVLIPVDDQEAASICAAMFLSSELGQRVSLRVDEELIKSKGRLARFAIRFKVRWLTRVGRLRPRRLLSPQTQRYRHNQGFNNPGFEDLLDDLTRLPDDLPPYTLSMGHREGPGFAYSSRLPFGAVVDVSREMLLLRRAAPSTELGRNILQYERMVGMAGYTPWSDDPRHVDWVVARSSNWEVGKHHYLSLALQLVAVSTLYGGWHLLAWNGPFPSRAYEILWRVSGLGVAVSGVIICAAVTLLNWLERVPRVVIGIADRLLPLSHQEQLSLVDLLSRARVAVMYIVFVSLVVAPGLLFLFARCYLVVGSFLSLPYAPDSAFVTPAWSLYFPHIG